MRIFSLHTVIIFLFVSISCTSTVIKQQGQKQYVLLRELANFRLGQTIEAEELIPQRLVLANISNDKELIHLYRDGMFYVVFYYSNDLNARNDFIANGLYLLINKEVQIVAIVCIVEDYRKKIPVKESIVSEEFSSYKKVEDLEGYSKEIISHWIDERNVQLHQELLNDMMLRYMDYVVDEKGPGNAYYVEFSDGKTSWIFTYDREMFLIIVSLPGIIIDIN